VLVQVLCRRLPYLFWLRLLVRLALGLEALVLALFQRQHRLYELQLLQFERRY
jgi:hypothetical protein